LASLYEVHLFDATFVADYCLTSLVNPTIKVDNELIDEASFAFLEEVAEAFLELLELRSLHDQLRLHLRCDLLEELKLFNDQIVIIEECLVDVVLNIIIKVWLNMKWLV